MRVGCHCRRRRAGAAADWHRRSFNRAARRRGSVLVADRKVGCWADGGMPERRRKVTMSAY
jgi:hypothetical protein